MSRRIPPPSDEAVVRAWRRTGGRRPTAVEPVGSRRSKKSVVFRLVGVGEGRRPVVAKLCRGRQAATERFMYEEVLPKLEIPLPRYYGSLEDVDGVWLFLSDGGETRCDPSLRRHRELAGRWLARVHGAGMTRPLPDLPDRGPGHHLGLLRQGRQGILDNLGNPVFDAVHRAVLESVVVACEELEGCWGEIEAFAAALPSTFVHGDFCRKNLHVISSPEGPVFFPLDWEMAGWGIPACDLIPTRKAPRRMICDVGVYADEMRALWPELDDALLRRVIGLGRIFRNLAGIAWASVDLPHRWPEKPVVRMLIYGREIEGALREALWAA